MHKVWIGHLRPQDDEQKRNIEKLEAELTGPLTTRTVTSEEPEDNELDWLPEGIQLPPRPAWF